MVDFTDSANANLIMQQAHYGRHPRDIPHEEILVVRASHMRRPVLLLVLSPDSLKAVRVIRKASREKVTMAEILAAMDLEGTYLEMTRTVSLLATKVPQLVSSGEHRRSFTVQHLLERIKRLK